MFQKRYTRSAMKAPMFDDQGSSAVPTFGQWLWFASVLTVVGYAIIVLTVLMHVHTLFDYNGSPSKSSGPPPPSELSALEAIFVFEFLATAVATAVFLFKAWGARLPGSIRWYHFFPFVIAVSSLGFGVFMVGFAVLEMLG